MFNLILIILIGAKLNMLNGWFLTLVIISCIFNLIVYSVNLYKAGQDL